MHGQVLDMPDVVDDGEPLTTFEEIKIKVREERKVLEE